MQRNPKWQQQLLPVSMAFVFVGVLVIGVSTALIGERLAYAEEVHESLEGDHDRHKNHKNHEEHHEGVSLSPQQIKFAKIKVVTLTPRRMDYRLYAPGEIKANAYTSYGVSSRVDSVVLRRHVALGEHVEKGQALVTLFSATVAEVQARFWVAQSEWRRVKKLGQKSVGDKRYIAAQAEYEAILGRLKSFGFSDKKIRLAGKQKPSALGEYTLTAESSGRVLNDDFKQGQRMQAGDSLMELVDERELWVEARLAPNRVLHLPVGTQAQVQVGKDWYVAEVAQEAHAIDPKTRTRVVRLVIDNAAHRLHPGLFVDVYFSFKTKKPVMAVPESALMRSADGDWIVFVEEQSNEFGALEVEVGQALGEWREVLGIEAGSRVVTEGAFFVASQIAKGGFDPHNH